MKESTLLILYLPACKFSTWINWSVSRTCSKFLDYLSQFVKRDVSNAKIHCRRHSRCLCYNEGLEGQNSTFSIYVFLYIIRKPRKFCTKLEKQNSLALGSFFLIFGCLMSPPEGNAEFYKQKMAESSIRIQHWSKSTIAYMIDEGV